MASVDMSAISQTVNTAPLDNNQANNNQDDIPSFSEALNKAHEENTQNTAKNTENTESKNTESKNTESKNTENANTKENETELKTNDSNSDESKKEKTLEPSPIVLKKNDANNEDKQSILKKVLNNDLKSSAEVNEINENVGEKLKTSVKAEKTLQDIKNEAQSKNLNLKNIELESKNGKINLNEVNKNIDVNKNKLSQELQNKAQILANTINDNLNTVENKEDNLLAELLNRYNPEENLKRKTVNQNEKIEIKINNGDKVMVVQRGIIPPAEIVNSKLRNKEMEKRFSEDLSEILGDDKIDIKDLIEKNKEKLSLQKENLQKENLNLAQNGANSLAEGLKNISLEKLDNKDNKIGSEIIEKSEKKDEKQVDKKDKVDSKEATQAQLKQEVNFKNAVARETIKNFASQFRDELLNYKPPITKLNLELNPANLGTVQMSISKKGNDMQVSITSNTNVMTMFVQNSNELRNNLMQLGINNLDLNFSSNSGNSGSGNEDREEVINLTPDEAETKISEGVIPNSLEIILPNYA